MALTVEIEDIPENEEWPWAVSEPAARFEIDPEEGRLTREVRVEGVFTRTRREVFFSGTASTEMELTCSRCLEPFRHPLSVEVGSHFIPEPEDRSAPQEMELADGDIDIEFYSGNELDLAQSVYDQVMLSLPLVRLCRESCRGICCHCGMNLNKGACDCAAEPDVDPRLAVLKSLKDKLQ